MSGMIDRTRRAVTGDDTLTLTLFVGALEGIMGFVALRVAWLGEGDMPYLAPSIAIAGWILFKFFQKFIRPILE
jgi:hypothetical protein